MTELLNSGWEDSGGTDDTDDGKWSSSSNSTGETVAPPTEQKHHGTYSIKCTSNGGGGVEYARVSLTGQDLASFYMRAYVYISQQGCPDADDYMRFISAYAGTNEVATLGWYNNGGTLRWWLRCRNGTGYTSYYSTAATRNTGEWYCIELYWINSATAVCRGWVNGVNILTSASRDTDNYGNATILHFGLPYNNATSASIMYGDCAIIADTYIGPEATTYTKTFTHDALLQKALTKTFTSDGLLQKALTKTFTLDGLIQKPSTKTFTFDAQLQKSLTKTCTLDAILETGLAQYTKTFTFDAQLKLSVTAEFTFDSVLSKAGQSTADTKTQCFFANTRYWNFYDDGTHLVFRSSTDAVTWLAETPIRECTDEQGFSVWFDGTYVHYVYAAGSDMYYRRGTPNSNGTITWSTAEVTIPHSGAYCQNCIVPFISVDTNGYPYIGYTDAIDGNYLPFVTKGNANNGSFGSHDTGFPHALDTNIDPAWKVSVIPLTNGKMFAFGSSLTRNMVGEYWDGDSWEDSSAPAGISTAHSTVAIDDYAYVAIYTDAGDIDILYFPNGIYDTHTQLEPVENETSRPQLSKNSSNYLYCFWYINESLIKYKRYNGESWDEAATEWVDVAEVGAPIRTLSCYYQSDTSDIGVSCLLQPDTPYLVWFAVLTGIAAKTKTFTFDGLLQKSLTKTLTFDAQLQKAFTLGFTFDAILEAAAILAGDSHYYYYGRQPEKKKNMRELLAIVRELLTVLKS